MKERINKPIAFITILATVLIGWFLTDAYIQSNQLKTKAEFYQASESYAQCKREICGDCGQVPVWRNGE